MPEKLRETESQPARQPVPSQSGRSGRAGQYGRNLLFAGFLLMTTTVGGFAIYVGAEKPEGFARELLLGVGVAVGPASLVTLLFRIFLVGDVRRQFAEPLTDQVRETLQQTNVEVQERIHSELDRLHEELDRYHRELSNIEELGAGGLVRCYRNREEAMSDFLTRIRDDDGQMVVVGSTLRGVLPDADCDFAQEVRRRAKAVSLILMHPVVADLRADQERRPHKAIGREIVERLRLLDELGVPATSVYLRVGTPTCFGIMTRPLMLLNPYPYLSDAVQSPCFLISRVRGRIETMSTQDTGQISYIYDTFHRSHFDVGEIAGTLRLTDLRGTAEELGAAIDSYIGVKQKIDELSQIRHR